MAKKRGKVYSGIGGQAVLEGIMMKNKDKYAVAVRKPDGQIAVEVDNTRGVLGEKKIKEIPLIRGVFNFIDSMILGMRCINFSASVYDEEEDKADGGKGDKIVTALVTAFSVMFALGIFVVLPSYLTALFTKNLRNESLRAIIEGVLRILIFILYILLISAMKDIRRLFRYHGAEHQCINCLEKGKPLTVRNVMHSSRLHKRCGTSFIFFVLLVSVVLFFFIRVDNPLMRVLLRILLIPVVAGISYEIIRLAGRFDNILVRIISMPGMGIQLLTTKKPDKYMVEVAIAAVEAVFDWKGFLRENFGYEENQAQAEDSGQSRENKVEDGQNRKDEAEGI